MCHNHLSSHRRVLIQTLSLSSFPKCPLSTFDHDVLCAFPPAPPVLSVYHQAGLPLYSKRKRKETEYNIIRNANTMWPNTTQDSSMHQSLMNRSIFRSLIPERSLHMYRLFVQSQNCFSPNK